MKKNALPALALGSIALACVGAPRELNDDQRATQAEYQLAEPPTPQHEVDIRFESRVRLVGYDVSVDAVTPGQGFDITWYWQVDRRLPEGWMQFTHLVDAEETNRCNADHTTTEPDPVCAVNAPIRGNWTSPPPGSDEPPVWVPNFDPSDWVEGTWVRDPEHITLPTDWHSDRLNIYVGFWSGSHRLSVTSGPSDGESRGRAVSLPISGGARTHASLERLLGFGRRG